MLPQVIQTKNTQDLAGKMKEETHRGIERRKLSKRISSSYLFQEKFAFCKSRLPNKFTETAEVALFKGSTSQHGLSMEPRYNKTILERKVFESITTSCCGVQCFSDRSLYGWESRRDLLPCLPSANQVLGQLQC